jgi:NEDD8-activating enzyme E1
MKFLPPGWDVMARLMKTARTAVRLFPSLTGAQKVTLHSFVMGITAATFFQARVHPAGLKGQVKLMLPRVSSCFECGLDTFPPETTFAMCTIAERPRKPEHCVAYAMMVLWDRAFAADSSHCIPLPPPPNSVPRKYDTDSPADMRWIYERAAERAAEFGIPGVDYMMTLVPQLAFIISFVMLSLIPLSLWRACFQGVVKNIIPAVASTNAVISALAVAEAVKLVTFCSQSLNNFYSYMGQEGINTSTYSMERKDDCLVCQQQKFVMAVSPRTLLRDLLAKLEAERWAGPCVLTKISDSNLC